MSGAEKLLAVVSLVEETTSCRFEYGPFGPYVTPGRDAYFIINMHHEFLSEEEHKISFDARIQRLGHPMCATGMLALSQEALQVYSLLAALELQPITLTDEEWLKFSDVIAQRTCRSRTQEPGQFMA